MSTSGRIERAGVALLATRLSRLGEDPCGGSEVVLWEDASIFREAGIPVRVYARAAREGAPVNVIPLRGRNPQLHSIQYGGQLLRREREALIIAYNEPALAGWAPDRTIVRFDWNTPLPRYWSWPFWLPRFQRARYLFPSESERELFLSQHARIPASSTFVIPNAVDLDLFRPMGGREAARAKGALRIGFAGQWVPGKGIAELLEAWRMVKAAHPVAELILAGGPDLWKTGMEIAGAREATSRVQQMEREGRLHCAGCIPRAFMPQFWNSVDIAVVPSLRESFGLVALEALACGVPVVAAAVGGLKEIVVDGECGLLVPPGDARALADALLALLERDELRMRLAAAARSRAQRFSRGHRSNSLLRLVFQTEEQAARASRKKFPIG